MADAITPGRVDLGAVSAYAVAVEHGFDGTEAEWEEYIANASNNAAAANTSKLAAEGYAVGKQNGVDVPSSSPYFENNSKYYMEQAKASVPADYTELIGDVEDLKSALDDIDTILEYLPTETIPVEQYSINANTGMNTSNSYTLYYRTAGFYNPKHIKATSTRGVLSSRLYFYANESVDSFVSAGDFVTDMDMDIVYPSGANYLRISGTVQGNPDNPLNLSAVKLEMKFNAEDSHTVITDIKNNINDIQNTFNVADVSNVIASHVDDSVPYNLIPSDLEWFPNKQISPNDGTIADYAGRYVSGYIPIDSSKQYIFLRNAITNKEYDVSTGTYTNRTVSPFIQYNYAFYDENHVFVASTSSSADIIKIIPSTAKYIRVTVGNQEGIKYAVLLYAPSANSAFPTMPYVHYKKIPKQDYQMPLTGYENFKLIAFGDSITHGDLTGNNDGFSYVNYAAQYLNTDIESVGFGSTTAAQDRETPTETRLFAFWKLCDCITSDDPSAWSELDAWATSGNTSYAEHLARLKSVDWNEVNAISILYGANDWAANIPVGDDYNTDKYNYDGAIAYGITKLLTKYPHLQVMILSPFFRRRTVSGTAIISDDPNTQGLTMPDYAESLKNVQKKLHVPVVDSGNWGFNELTINVVTLDGTHPITDIGKQRLGHLFANAIQLYLSPE